MQTLRFAQQSVGSAALELAAREDFEMIILELSLHGFSGYDFLIGCVLQG